jgi:hypothetical protein
MTGHPFAEERSLTQPLKEQRDKATFSLFAWFAIAVIVFPIAAPRAPQWLKTAALLLGTVSAGGGTMLLRENAQRSKIDDSLEKMQLDALKQQVIGNAAFHQITGEIQSKTAVANWIGQNFPPHLWMVFGQKYGVAEFFIQPGQPPIEAEYEEILPLAIPGELMGQSSLTHEQAQSIAASLDTAWFQDWAKRGGIVCGESGDGKSFLLCNIVLAEFVRDHGHNGRVYICDPDYGSSHPGQQPNTWLDLTVGQHIYINASDCYAAIMAVSNEVDRRAEQTAMAFSQRQSLAPFDPILLIADEVPALMVQWTEAQQLAIVNAIANILRRGIKQNVTFKLGTQSLAVSRLKLNKDIIQQSEIVMLWRAAQVPDNYGNMGLRPKVADAVIDEISTLPHQCAGVFACATYIQKQLTVAGIPAMQPVTTVGVADRPTQESIATAPESVPGVDVYTILKAWQQNNPNGTDAQLVLQFMRHTGRSLNPEQLEMLKDYLSRLP